MERDRIYMEFPMAYLKLSPNALEDAFVLKLDGWEDEKRGRYQRLWQILFHLLSLYMSEIFVFP